MGKSLWDIKQEIIKKYYPKKKPTYYDFKVGDRVKVITPCQDFNFFYEETGIIIENSRSYLGIIVKLDEPRKFENGKLQEKFGFEPIDLYKLKGGSNENKR